MRKQILLGCGKDLIGLQVVLARGRRRHAVHGQDHDIHFSRIGFRERLFQMLEMERVAAGDQNIAGPGLICWEDFARSGRAGTAPDPGGCARFRPG